MSADCYSSFSYTLSRLSWQIMPETSHLVSHSPKFEKLRLEPRHDGGLWLRHGGGGVYHRHAELELNLCVAGHAHYLVGEHRFHLSRHSLLWLFAAQNHLLLDASPDFVMWIVVWKPRLIEAVCRQSASRELTQKAPDPTWFARLAPGVAASLELLYQNLSEAPTGDHLNAGLGYALMESHAAYRRAGEAVVGRAVHPCVESAARILQGETLDLPALAHRVGLSPHRLSRLFRAQIGATVTEFRTKMALERFVQLYDGQSLSLTQCAAEAGFGSYAGFHRAFVTHYGYAPARHRERLRAGESAMK